MPQYEKPFDEVLPTDLDYKTLDPSAIDYKIQHEVTGYVLTGFLFIAKVLIDRGLVVKLGSVFQTLIAFNSNYQRHFFKANF